MVLQLSCFSDIVDGLSNNKIVFELNIAKSDISDEGMAAIRFVDLVLCLEYIVLCEELNSIALNL